MFILGHRFIRILIPLIFSLGFLVLFFTGTLVWASNVNSNLAPSNVVSSIEQTPSPGDIQVVRVYYVSQEILNRIAARIVPWEVNKDQGFLIVDVDASEYEWLAKMGLKIEIDQKLTDQYNTQRVMSMEQTSGIPGYPCYRTVEETYAYAQSLVITYPNLTEWIDIGDSWDKTQNNSTGYDLYVLRITNKNINLPKPKLFVMSGLHAREFAPPGLNTYFAEYLLENYNIDPDITWLLDYHEIHLLLQANPDGRKYAESGYFWRKNTNKNYCSPTSLHRGADLNRNFSLKWHFCADGYCSSSNECDDTYRGESAASEPETQAIQTYLRAQFPDQRDDSVTSAAPITSTGVFIDLHSYGSQVLWPWGFTIDPAPNGTALETLGRKFSFFNQYDPQQASVGLYFTDGDSDGSAYGDLGLAGFTFEIGRNFFESCSYYQNTILPENLPALMYAAKIARYPYMLPSGPEAVNLSISPSLATTRTPILLQATINDKRFYGNDEPTQVISTAECYIDNPPWITTTIPISQVMNVEDGIFDENIETVTVSINTDGLAQGRHIIFVRGQDAAGNWGPVSAQFLYIYDHQFFLPNIINP
jgi:carboxypeptidase T